MNYQGRAASRAEDLVAPLMRSCSGKRHGGCEGEACRVQGRRETCQSHFTTGLSTSTASARTVTKAFSKKHYRPLAPSAR